MYAILPVMVNGVSSCLVNFTLSRTFLIHMETPLCAKLRTQHGGTESLILSV